MCEFVAAMASAGASAAQLLISSGILAKLRIPFQDFVRNAQLTPAEQRTKWDDEGADADDGFPSLPAMEAVLDALEVRDLPHHAQAYARTACNSSRALLGSVSLRAYWLETKAGAV